MDNDSTSARKRDPLYTYLAAQTFDGRWCLWACDGATPTREDVEEIIAGLKSYYLDHPENLDQTPPIRTRRRRPRPKPSQPHLASNRPVPKRIRRVIFEADNYTCRHCGATDNLSIDHIIPRSKGGTNDPENLQTLCRPCNSRKRDLL